MPLRQRSFVAVRLRVVTGNDEYGWIMREMLRGEKIDISHLHEMEGETCQMKMDLIGGVDRVHLEEIEGVMRDFALSEEDKEFIKEHDFLHTDLFGNCLQDLRELHEAGVKVVMDFSTFSDDPEFNTDENYRNVDYAFLSYEQEDSYILSHLKKISSFGPEIVTATLGEKGSISYDGKEFYRCGIIPVKTVNTVGAGDSYIAGFTYGVIQGWTIPECQQFGARLSASVVTKFEPY